MLGLRRILAATTFLLLISSLSTAEVYRTVDSYGNAIFTDKKTENESSEIVEIRPIQTIPAPSMTPKKPIRTKTNDENFYKSVDITIPIEEETFQNPESISLTLKTAPPLSAGHRYRLSINNKIYDESSVEHFTIKNPDRGTLLLKAEILNAKGKNMITSEPRTIYVHRAFIRKPKITPK